MQKPVVHTQVETWMVRNDGRKAVKSDLHGEKRPTKKVAVRVKKGLPLAGTFHGATNYQGTFL